MSRSTLFLQHDKGCAKFLICIENAKFKKPRTWPSSKIISEKGHVFQNAKFLKLKEIKNLAHQETFFVYSKMRAFPVRYTQFLTTNWAFLYHVHNTLELHNCVKISSQWRDLGIATRGRILLKSLPSEKNHFFVVTGVKWLWSVIMTLRSEGSKKIQQVYTTILFESSRKTRSKLIKLIFK